MVDGLVEVPEEQLSLLLEAGYLYLEMQKPKEAEEVFEGVSALVPASEVPLICLGNLFFSQGRYERALKFHRRALEKNAGSALATAHVGEALLFLGRRDEARSTLQAAAGMEPDGPAAAFANRLLDGMAAGVV
jgi:tetratricopeptide (TPR) repeat protein